MLNVGLVSFQAQGDEAIRSSEPARRRWRGSPQSARNWPQTFSTPPHQQGPGHSRSSAPTGAGALLGDLARYLLAVGLVIVLGLAIGFRPAGGAAGTLAAAGLLLVFALALSWAWATLGLLLCTPQAVMSAGTIVLFPLTLASNVFVAPRAMPGWLQAFVHVNPVTHLVIAERALMAGQPAAGQVAWVLLASAAPAAAFAPVTA